jgi:dTDP-4-amino-4,6-dideoxygalactose transaminase
MNLWFSGNRPQPPADLEIFSFMLNKQLTTIKGGLVCSQSPSAMEAMAEARDRIFAPKTMGEHIELRALFLTQVTGYNRAFYRFGLKLQDRSQMLRRLVHYYDESRPGLPHDAFHRFSAFQARIGISQLKRFREREERRSVLWDAYARDLSSLADAEILRPRNRESAPYFCLLVPARKAFIEGMREAGVDVEHIFEYAVPNLDYYSRQEMKKSSYPISEYLARRMVNLPLYPSLSRRDVTRICDKVKRHFASEGYRSAASQERRVEKC